MPVYYCLHGASVQNQHPTHQHAQNALVGVLEQLEKLRPLLERRQATVLYDLTIEARSLENSKRNFLGLVNSLGLDYCTRWFMAVKNYCEAPSAARAEIVARDLPNRHAQIGDAVPGDFLIGGRTWLSFGGTTVFDAQSVELTVPNQPVLNVANYTNVQSLEGGWPKYEPSPKHRLEEYQRNGEKVSAMDLSVPDASGALLVASVDGQSRYAVVRGKIYRFISTTPGATPEIFHGFRIDRKELPAKVARIFEANGEL